MKKTIITILALAAIALGASADNDRAVSYDRLPEKAKDFISVNFPDGRLAYSKEERDFMEVHYEVVLVAGVMIVFDRNGDWTDIECRYSYLDMKFIPEPVRTKVNDLYPGVSYKKISRERGRFEVKLSNGHELVFDRKFALVRIDD